MIVDNTDKAIAVASAKTGVVVNDYTAAPVYFSDNANGAHEWLIEFEKEPENLAVFTQELDAALKATVKLLDTVLFTISGYDNTEFRRVAGSD